MVFVFEIDEWFLVVVFVRIEIDFKWGICISFFWIINMWFFLIWCLLFCFIIFFKIFIISCVKFGLLFVILSVKNGSEFLLWKMFNVLGVWFVCGFLYLGEDVRGIS